MTAWVVASLAAAGTSVLRGHHGNLAPPTPTDTCDAARREPGVGFDEVRCREPLA